MPNQTQLLGSHIRDRISKYQEDQRSISGISFNGSFMASLQERKARERKAATRPGNFDKSLGRCKNGNAEKDGNAEFRRDWHTPL
jgi:hypothetical protein